jgi:hypothetical protein
MPLLGHRRGDPQRCCSVWCAKITSEFYVPVRSEHAEEIPSVADLASLMCGFTAGPGWSPRRDRRLTCSQELTRQAIQLCRARISGSRACARGG